MLGVEIKNPKMNEITEPPPSHCTQFYAWVIVVAVYKKNEENVKKK